MNNAIRCDGFRRRDLIRVGGLTALGLGLGDFFRLKRATAAGAELKAKAKSCILIWLDGGPSHLESFDPKPEAPEEVRGPLTAIATNVAGVQISECLELTAQVMDKLTVVRSITSSLGEHNFSYSVTPDRLTTVDKTNDHLQQIDRFVRHRGPRTIGIKPPVEMPARRREIQAQEKLNTLSPPESHLATRDEAFAELGDSTGDEIRPTTQSLVPTWNGLRRFAGFRLRK
mgnify:CR=1 FL=1